MSDSIHQIDLDGQIYQLEDKYARNKIETMVQVVSSSDECVDNDVLYLMPQGHTMVYRGSTYRSLSFVHFDDDIEQGGEYMQVCFYSKEKSGFIVTNNDMLWDMNDMTPIGIVVVPLSHNVYEDGSVGVMSLVNMSWKTPDEGDLNRTSDDDVLMYWGGSNHGLSANAAIPILGNCNSAPKDKITGTLDSNVFIPTDASWATGPMCETDITTKYYASTDGSRGWGPSPFLGSGRNPVYYQTTSPASTSNPLARYDGKEQTDILVEKSTYQLDWLTDSEIENKYTNNHFPAAMCCHRYRTEHTHTGDWYLPAEGELTYVIPRYAKITKTINRLNSIFGNVAKDIEYEITQNYWSSTVGSGTDNVLRISTYNATIGRRASSAGASCARAFTKIIPLEVI